MNFSDWIVKGSNKLELYAEAAYIISLKPPKEFTGNFFRDEAILREEGIDPAQYAVDPTAIPVKNIFLLGVDYTLSKR